jgi:hypothetical protein
MSYELKEGELFQGCARCNHTVFKRVCTDMETDLVEVVIEADGSARYEHIDTLTPSTRGYAFYCAQCGWEQEELRE